MRLILWAPLVLLLAGCTAPSSPGGSDNASHPDPQAPDPTVWTDCDQWHLHFDARAEDFEAQVPPGYTVIADEAGLTTLLIHVTLCSGTQEAYLGVPVHPPAEHDDADRAELATIQIFHGGHDLGLYPQPFDRRLVEANFEISDTPLGPSLTVEGGGETFTVTNALHPSSGTFSAEHWARISYDNGQYGILNADGGESSNVGFGAVTYMHQGPGGAPPATVGIAHIVTGLDIHITTETRP